MFLLPTQNGREPIKKGEERGRSSLAGCLKIRLIGPELWGQV
jgi:hypothetical protein